MCLMRLACVALLIRLCRGVTVVLAAATSSCVIRLRTATTFTVPVALLWLRALALFWGSLQLCACVGSRASLCSIALLRAIAIH